MKRRFAALPFLLTLLGLAAFAPSPAISAQATEPAASFYTDSGQGGKGFSLVAGDEQPVLADKFNDKLSSVNVRQEGVVVELFEEPNFTGRSVQLRRGIHELGMMGMHDRVSSIRIRRETPATDGALGHGGPLAGRVRTARLPLPRTAQPVTGDAAMLLSPLPAGGFVVVWNERPGVYGPGSAHLAQVSPKLAFTGKETALKGYFVTSLLTHSDGSMAVLARAGAELDEWWFLRLGAAGAVLVKTRLAGGEGRGSGKFWAGALGQGRLAWTGAHYAVFLPIRKNWATENQKANVHDGDHFVAVAASGAVLPQFTQHWSASDSFEQRVVATPGGATLTAAVANAYPLGVVLARRAEGPVITRLLFPTEAASKSLQQRHGTFKPATLGSVLPHGEGLLAVITTALDTAGNHRGQRDVLLLRADTQGAVLASQWLNPTPGQDETLATLAPYGSYFLLATSTGKEAPATLSVITETGVVLEGPVAIKTPLSPHHDLVDLPGGGAAWLLQGERDLTLVVVVPP